METTIFDKKKYKNKELADMINEMAFGKKKQKSKKAKKEERGGVIFGRSSDEKAVKILEFSHKSIFD